MLSLTTKIIELKALAALRRNDDIAPNSHVNATSYNGILLLTGETLSEDTRRRITRLVENIDKVRRVHNELAIAAPSSMLSRSSDSVITAKIKTALGRHSFEIAARTKVVTENGVVYLMGLVAARRGRCLHQHRPENRRRAAGGEALRIHRVDVSDVGENHVVTTGRKIHTGGSGTRIVST